VLPQVIFGAGMPRKPAKQRRFKNGPRKYSEAKVLARTDSTYSA
jgi:hypothetical protein